MAKYWRDTMIGLIRRDIESYYRGYEAQLAEHRQRFLTAVDVTSLAGVAAATITNGARAKTVISTMVAFLQGAHGKIDQNIFRERTTDVIIQKMRASRARVETMIVQKMVEQDAVAYVFGDAERDLRELFWAGTLQGGFLELALSAGNDAAQATEDRNRTEERVRGLLPIATGAQRTLSRRLDEKVTDLARIATNNPNNNLGRAALQTVLDALNSLQNQNQRVSTEPLPSNTSDGQRLFRLLRFEMADALSSAEKMAQKLPALAQALGIPTT